MNRTNTKFKIELPIFDKITNEHKSIEKYYQRSKEIDKNESSV